MYIVVYIGTVVVGISCSWLGRERERESESKLQVEKGLGGGNEKKERSEKVWKKTKTQNY